MGKTVVTLHENEGIKPLIRHPVRRLWTVAVLLVLIVLLAQPAVLAGTVGLLLVLLLWCGISLRLIAARMLLILPFGAGAVAFIPFHTPGAEAFRILGFAATEEGVERATAMLLKLAGANLLLTYLLAVTPLFVLLRSLRSIGVPAVLLEIMMLIMRYFFLLKEEASGMFKAQRSRGMQAGSWWWSVRTYRRFGQMVGVLFLRAYRRSERIYLAMSARGGLEGDRGVQGGERSVETSADGKDKSEGGVRLAAEIVNAGYSYGTVPALRGVTFDVHAGTKVALMGPNGAGKSTLISLLNGLETTDSGEVRLFGETVTRGNADRLRRRVGVVYQDPDDQLFSTTVEEDVAFGPRNLGLSEEEVEDRVETALRSVGMNEYRRRSPFELSYGQKRRVAIAGVLAMQPELIVLDEPMSFLDPRGRDELQALLESMHRKGLTTMVATHDVDFAAEWADRVILLKDGKLLASGTAELLFDDELLERASLHLPRLARPFRLLSGAEGLKPRSVRQAAQMIWKLMMGGSDASDAPGADGRDQDAGGGRFSG